MANGSASNGSITPCGFVLALPYPGYLPQVPRLDRPWRSFCGNCEGLLVGLLVFLFPDQQAGWEVFPAVSASLLGIDLHSTRAPGRSARTSRDGQTVRTLKLTPMVQMHELEHFSPRTSLSSVIMFYFLVVSSLARGVAIVNVGLCG